ncbi:MAG: ABC transporter ATP-binding protein [Oscillospiraceae bacterium]|nr:ABC transporter ATP-binding protein [Oscillospiraceae bacterium]
MREDGGSEILLDVMGLDVSFQTRRGDVRAVNGISYCVRRGEAHGLVGESGGGKSVGVHAIMGLLGTSSRVNAGSALFEGRDILRLKKGELASLRGREISMIFQNPSSYLDPVFTIGSQMIETIRAHDRSISKGAARSLSEDMLWEVGIRDPERRMRQYPFELSGGMSQRVMIAIALLCKPKLLIADEPTTALDVTTQAQIIRLLKNLQSRSGMAMLYITHNFGIVAELCDRVSVICGGYIVEQGSTDDIFYGAAHPYTQALLKLIPRIDSPKNEPAPSIGGPPVDSVSLPKGCVFRKRCPFRMDICSRDFPPRINLAPYHSANCWLLELGKELPGDGQNG